MPFSGLVVIVPTRNRAALAAAAVQSVIDAGCPDVQVLVSDNSTDASEVDRLSAACGSRGTDYVRPPHPLSMADHWEWALEQGLAISGASHIAVLTDRMLFQDGALSAIVALARTYPDRVVSYGHDLIDDSGRPVRLEQVPWTGHVLEVPVDALVGLIARSMHWATEPVLPRLLNCLAPRSVTSEVREKFGARSGDAIAPDYAFAFRCLTTIDSILFYDRPALMPYALDRSNGTSQVRGRVSADHADFVANVDPRGMNFAAPIPGLPTALSTILHEYARVRDQAPGWPEVNWDRYLAALAEEAAVMDEGPMRRKSLRALEQVASDSRTARRSSSVERTSKLANPPRVLVTLAWMRAMRRSPLWRPIERLTGLSAPDLRTRTTSWETRQIALANARARPRRPHAGMSRFEFVARRELGRVSIRRITTMRS